MDRRSPGVGEHTLPGPLQVLVLGWHVPLVCPTCCTQVRFVLAPWEVEQQSLEAVHAPSCGWHVTCWQVPFVQFDEQHCEFAVHAVPFPMHAWHVPAQMVEQQSLPVEQVCPLAAQVPPLGGIWHT